VLYEWNKPVVHCANKSPTLLLHGRKFIKNTPIMLGTKYKNPTYARLFGIQAARVTPVQMVTISTRPSTQPKSVVWRGVNPNEDTMICLWFVREFGILSSAEKSAKSHVLGSASASIILHMNHDISHFIPTSMGKYGLFPFEMLVFDSSLVFLENDRHMKQTNKQSI